MQADILKRRFLEKGYREEHIDEAIDRYTMGGESRRIEGKSEEPSNTLFITKFTNQHWAVKRAIKKH